MPENSENPIKTTIKQICIIEPLQMLSWLVESSNYRKTLAKPKLWENSENWQKQKSPISPEKSLMGKATFSANSAKILKCFFLPKKKSFFRKCLQFIFLYLYVF